MLTINFHPFKNLESDRLLLRRVTTDDADGIFTLRSNAETMKFIPRPLAKTKEDAIDHVNMINEKIDNNTGINWTITLKNDPNFIGLIGLYRIEPENYRAEIGYMLLPEHHGKGIITEAVNLVNAYGFDELKLHSIEAIIDPENAASEALLKKCGFVKEAHILENEFFEDKFWDTVIYSLLERNFKR